MTTNLSLNNTQAFSPTNFHRTFEINTNNATHFNNRATGVIKPKKVKSNSTDSSWDNTLRSKRSNAKTRQIFERNTRNTTSPSNQIKAIQSKRITAETNKTHLARLQSQRSPSLSTGSSGFEELMNQVDINSDGSAHGDPEKDAISKPLQGLEGSSFYPEVLKEGKKTVDQILSKLRSSYLPEVLEKGWEDLAKALQVVHEYQRDRYLDPKSIDEMEGSLRNLARLFSNTSITTKAQFLAFKNWVNIASFNLSNKVGLNNFDLTNMYLMKLSEILSSPHQEIQNLVHTHSNSLFEYQFIGKCSNTNCTVKEALLTTIEKTFDLCKKVGGEKNFYLTRNALLSFEKVLKNSNQLSFQHEFITKIEQGFNAYFANLTRDEETIVKQLSSLTIKSIQEQGIAALLPFTKKTTVRDIYPYQTEILIRPIRVNITSALDRSHNLMKQLPVKLRETYSILFKHFGRVLNMSTQEVKSDLYIAKDKESYEIFNYILLGKSTGNGGVTECVYEEQSCIPSAAMYIQGDKIWNLEHEVNHVLLHLYAGLKVNHQMNTFGKYGRLDWLNEGLAYVLVPNNFIEGDVKQSLISEGLPNIKGIIEASQQDYAISYSLVDYLLNKQKSILDRILVYTKDEKKDLLKEELEKLSSLESDYHSYLMTRWNLSGNMPKSPTKSQLLMTTRKQWTESRLADRTTVGSRPAESITRSNQEDERIKEKKDAVAENVACKSALGDAAVEMVAWAALALTLAGTVALGTLRCSGILSKQQGGNGRNHSRRGDNKGRYRDKPSRRAAVKLLQDNRKFPRKDSNPSQRKNYV